MHKFVDIEGVTKSYEYKKLFSTNRGYRGHSIFTSKNKSLKSIPEADSPVRKGCLKKMQKSFKNTKNKIVDVHPDSASKQTQTVCYNKPVIIDVEHVVLKRSRSRANQLKSPKYRVKVNTKQLSSN